MKFLWLSFRLREKTSTKMSCFQLVLVLVTLLGPKVGLSTQPALSTHSDNLVRMFRDYLVNMETQQRESASIRNRRSTDDAAEYLRICKTRKDCGSVVQNFGFFYDPNSGFEFCNTNYLTKPNANTTCFDSFQDCRLLKNEFGLCKNAELVAKLGCHMTCGNCKPLPRYSSA